MSDAFRDVGVVDLVGRRGGVVGERVVGPERLDGPTERTEIVGDDLEQAEAGVVGAEQDRAVGGHVRHSSR
jgi:hypothetical protein